MRSPNREFAVGDKVETRGNRVYDTAALADDRTYGAPTATATDPA